MTKLSKYIVFYGFAKLTKKVVKKRSIVIQFANTTNLNERQMRYINQKMHIAYKRYQTESEAKYCKEEERSWTKWEYFVDEKRWKGNLDLVLEHNFVADANHVSLKERQEIRTVLEKEYYKFYGLPKKQKGQISLIFD